MKYLYSVFIISLLIQCTESKDSQEARTYFPPAGHKVEIGYPCTLRINEADSQIINLTEFNIPKTTIRALQVINDSTLWFAGSNGYWGNTQDNGVTWFTKQLKIDSIVPEFRSISVTDNGAIFLVSILKPAAIFKSTNRGNSWKIVYQDTDTNAFFDAIEFWDSQNGILLGDAINGCFHVAITNDGGETWNRVNCDNLPVALDGENPFAASNTNISLSGNSGWFATGGTNKSRVYHTPDFGKSWQVFNTPIIAGETMTGIYSIHFSNNTTGLVAGGNWEHVSDTNANLALTYDGGLTWTKIDNPIGFMSCAQFLPNSTSEIMALQGRARGGNSKMAYSNDTGKTWQVFPNENYLSIQFANRNKAWISGKNKIARIDFN